MNFPHALIEGCSIPLQDNGFGVDDTPTIRGMSNDPSKCYGCDDRAPIFTDNRTGRRFCHSCVEVLASWENDGCPDPDEVSYPDWIGPENVWRPAQDDGREDA